MAHALPAPPETRALPREAMVFFVVAPPVMALLFDPECAKDAAHLIRAMGTLGAYTIITGLGVHLGFEQVARRLAGASILVRVPAHLASTALIVGALTLAQSPLIRFVYPEAAGDVDAIFWRGLIVSYGYLAGASFVAHLTRQAVRERLRAHEERTAALEARLATLSAQLQPHFLFNSLNVCAGLVHEDPDAAEQTLDTLAAFLRYTLESTERRVVSLDEELEAVRAYLEVQRQRFGDRLAVEVDVAPGAGRWELPPMTLQPLVENALIHGLRDRREGGVVRLVAAERGGARSVTVEDDGVGPGASKGRGTGTGLRNVRERLRLVLGDDADLSTGPSELGGFAAEVRLGPAG